MEYPKNIMKNILWNFEKEKFDSKKKFKEEVLNYNKEIKGEEITFDLEEVIFKTPKITIQYSYWDIDEDGDDDDDILEPILILKPNNGYHFTALEILYKVHNEVCENLKDEDHKFFEGFDLWEGENHNNPEVPLYFLNQGS